MWGRGRMNEGWRSKESWRRLGYGRRHRSGYDYSHLLWYRLLSWAMDALSTTWFLSPHLQQYIYLAATFAYWPTDSRTSHKDTGPYRCNSSTHCFTAAAARGFVAVRIAGATNFIGLRPKTIRTTPFNRLRIGPSKVIKAAACCGGGERGGGGRECGGQDWQKPQVRISGSPYFTLRPRPSRVT